MRQCSPKKKRNFMSNTKMRRMKKKANLRLAYLGNLEKNLSIPEDFRMEVKDKAQEYRKAETRICLK